VEAALIDGVVDVATEIREKGITLFFTPEGPAKVYIAILNFKHKSCSIKYGNM